MSRPENIMILGTLHKTHEENKRYRYEHILEFAERYRPDILCVEIRQEDMGRENSILRQYYPPEMVLMKERYESFLPIYGFDWRGDQLEGRPVEDFSKEIDTLFDLSRNDPEIKEFISQRKKLMYPFYDNCSLEECQKNYPFYAVKLEIIDNALNDLLNKKGYHGIIAKGEKRERIIQQNIARIQDENKGKKILVITGISHKPLIEAYLKELV